MKKFLIVAGFLVALHIVVAVLLFRPQIVDENRWRLNLPLPLSRSTYAICSSCIPRCYQVIGPTTARDGGVVLDRFQPWFQRIPR